MIEDYNSEIQMLFVSMMCSNAELYTRVINILNPNNFDKTTKPIVEFMVDHATKYSVLPSVDQIKAATGEEIQIIPDLNEGHSEWFLDEFENFTKRQELERAIIKAADLLEKGEFNPVEKLIKDAVQISLQRDMGTDYFSDPKGRLHAYFNQGGQVSTGWGQLDRLMYGGFSRGELNIFAGGSGSGKSLLMMNSAINLLQQGLNGVYITLELSEGMTSLRTDAMLTDMSTKEIRKCIEDVELKVKMQAKKMGKYQVKWMPAQSNVNDIRGYIKEFQIKTGTRIDFVIVDYLDLVMPVSVKVNPNDQFIKDKYVSEELRNLCKELNVIMITASQLNRSAVEEIEFDHSHIAGGISKINTADYVFGIFTSRSMRERGKYQIQCMKSRSSTGVGQKIDLDYNMDTMRITDSESDTDSTVKNTPNTSILNKLKRTTVETTVDGDQYDSSTGEIIEEDIKKVKGTPSSTKLKSLLSSLKEK